jgi:hypothetical protein
MTRWTTATESRWSWLNRKHLTALGQPSVLQISETNTGYTQQSTMRITTTQGQAVALTSHFWILECHQFNTFTAMALYWNSTCGDSHCSMQTGFWTYCIQIANGSKQVENITGTVTLDSIHHLESFSDHNVLETDSVSIIRYKGRNVCTLLGPLERASPFSDRD